MLVQVVRGQTEPSLAVTLLHVCWWVRRGRDGRFDEQRNLALVGRDIGNGVRSGRDFLRRSGDGADGAGDRFPLQEEFADSLEQPDPFPLVAIGTNVVAGAPHGEGAGPNPDLLLLQPFPSRSGAFSSAEALITEEVRLPSSVQFIKCLMKFARQQYARKVFQLESAP